MIPTFVISLPDSAARRATLASNLQALDLPFEVVDAIDGRTGLPSALDAAVDRRGMQSRLGRVLTDAEIAAALSHAKAQRLVLDRGIKHALILEDDAICLPGLPLFLQAGGHEHAPLTLLHHLNARILKRSPVTHLAGVDLCELAIPCFRATAYALTPKGAQYLLEANSPVIDTADWPGDITRLGALVTEPQLVQHPPVSPEQSQITGSGRTRVRAPLSRMIKPGYVRRAWRKARSRRIS